MKKLLCKIARWVLYHCEPIDIFATKIHLNGGEYEITEVIQNHNFTEVTIKRKGIVLEKKKVTFFKSSLPK